MKQFQFPQDPGSVWIILDDGEVDRTIRPSQLPKAALKALKEGRHLTVEELRSFRVQETDEDAREALRNGPPPPPDPTSPDTGAKE